MSGIESSHPRLVDTVPRHFFMPDEYAHLWQQESVYEIGEGQTISQPRTVERMLGMLMLQEGQDVLDVGSGSGWTSAIISKVIGEMGRVVAMDRFEQLVKLGRNNFQQYQSQQDDTLAPVDFRLADSGVLGAPASGPYDRILISALASTFPEQLYDQLKVGGIMVLPIKTDVQWEHPQEKGEMVPINKICAVTKTPVGPLEIDRKMGYSFVRLVTE